MDFQLRTHRRKFQLFQYDNHPELDFTNHHCSDCIQVEEGQLGEPPNTKKDVRILRKHYIVAHLNFRYKFGVSQVCLHYFDELI